MGTVGTGIEVSRAQL